MLECNTVMNLVEGMQNAWRSRAESECSRLNCIVQNCFRASGVQNLTVKKNQDTDTVINRVQIHILDRITVVKFLIVYRKRTFLAWMVEVDIFYLFIYFWMDIHQR